MPNARIEYVDVAKGIGIILIIIGHCILPKGIIEFIFSFHVPLFFIISGFFIKPISLEGVKKTVRQLLIPLYFTTSLVVIVFIIWDLKDGAYEGPGILNLLSRYLFYRHYGVFGLWFLFALFWGKLLVQIVMKFFSIIITALFLIILFTISLYISKYYDPLIFPFDIVQGFSCAIFIFIGFLFHNKYRDQIFGRKLIRYMIPLSLLFCAYAPVNMAAGGYPFGVFNILLSSLFSFSIIILCYIFSRTRYTSLVIFYGKNTLAVLCIHGFIHSIYEMVGYNCSFLAGLLEIFSIGLLVLLLRHIKFCRVLYGIK